MDATSKTVGSGTAMIILFTIAIHLLCAGCAIYCIFHDEPFLAAYMVMVLMISAIKGHLKVWEDQNER